MAGKQLRFGDCEQATAKKRNRREIIGEAYLGPPEKRQIDCAAMDLSNFRL
jgi:hypothetical protein